MVAPGTEIGQYEILAPLGAGGMGEVYRARDTKLGREVALKVLPNVFALDPARLARFQREAHLLASLNHPNIAAIYGLEDSGGVRALVMELVEGRTLQESLTATRSRPGSRAVIPAQAGIQPAPEVDPRFRGGDGERRAAPLPLDEAVPIARQIAEALEYAHERGVIHRDLKPANIKLTPEDTIKVLDFGLAKALDPASSSPSGAEEAELQNSPTISTIATQAGMIMGTAAYMSPEQARGKPVDRRADIWAFGCVLYEMLTGRHAFEGETVSDVLSAVIKDEPDWSQLPSNTPAHVRVLLQRCLTKDPKQRLRDMGDARISLDEVLSGTAKEQMASAGLAPSVWRRVLPWAVGVVAGALVAGLIVWGILTPAPESPMHFSAVTSFAGVQAQPALSPDGRSVAFVSNRDGHYNIYVGLIRGGNLVQITNGPNAKSSPSWSPDGTTLAYARLNHWGVWDIWVVPALGGTPRRVILNAADPTWSPDGRWLAYVNTADMGIWISGISGEDAREVVPPWRKRAWDMQPRFSPDGRDLAFAARSGEGGPYGELAMADLDSGKTRLLTHDDALALSPAWSPDGRFIYFATSRGGTVNVWKIAATGGDPEEITAGEGDDVDLDISKDGKRLVFGTLRQKIGLAQLDLEAKPGAPSVRVLITDPARNQFWPAYSPDGKHLTYFTNLKGAEHEEIWVSDAGGLNAAPLVEDGRINIFPAWSEDSKSIIYVSEAASPSATQLCRDPAAGGAPQTLLTVTAFVPPDVGRDGRMLLRGPNDRVEAFDLRDGMTQVLGTVPSDARLWLWSPDEHSIAYMVSPRKAGDPNAGLWADDFKSSPRQIFHGWVVWYARGPGDVIYLLEGKPDLTAVLWKVNWNGKGLTRTSWTAPILYNNNYSRGLELGNQFAVSPDGHNVAFQTEQVLEENIGMIQNVR